jgi:DNA-binding transcriptional ArsR family regulator
MVEQQIPLDGAFAALSDPTRRAILSRLRAGGQTVTSLAEPFDMTLAGVSKHLRILERAGLIRREARGRERYCHLRTEPLRAVARWAAYVASWEARLDALTAHLAERRRSQGRGRGR